MADGRGRNTGETRIIENHARTFELPLEVLSVSQVGAEGASYRCFSPPNPKPEIEDVLALWSIILVRIVSGRV